MSNPPLVSVVMAVYNSDRYVAQAIDSILAQTFQEFELIVIDDGSSDASLKILQNYAAKDARIRVISRENRGIPRTRNELLAEARGELIAVMDSDDVALPDRLARQVDFLRSQPQVVCLGSAYQVIDEKGRLLTCLQVPQQDTDIQRSALAGHASIFQPCAMIRRDALVQVGGYDETMVQAEDLDLWLRLGEVGQLANLQEPLVKYRLHRNSVSEKDCLLQRQKAREACERAWQRRSIVGQFEAAEPWRPGEDRVSQHRFRLQYGWWAFNSGEHQTALIYGLKAIQVLPYKAEGWKLLLRVLFSRPLFNKAQTARIQHSSNGR